LTATNDPRFAEDIAHLQKLIAEANEKYLDDAVNRD
jgi:hypothetical protein